MMFDAIVEPLEPNRITKYQPTESGKRLSFAEVVDLWHIDGKFRQYFSDLLAQSPFVAYRWETPAFSARTASQPFEFVLLNNPRLATRPVDAQTFADYFTTEDTNQGIVSFTNLSGDATLIVPSPRAESGIYGHIASFVRGATKPQLDALWSTVGATMKAKLNTKPVWLNTAGGGVSWLHVRIDSHPKYYGYAPYRVRR